MFANLAHRARLPRGALPALAATATAATVPLLECRREQKSATQPGVAASWLLSGRATRHFALCESATVGAGAGVLQQLGKFGGGRDDFHAEYEIEEEIGRGTFGVVCRARHRRTQQLRAVKRVPAESSRRRHSSDGATAAGALAIGEVDALARLNHPNVARLIEHFAAEDEVLMVQELCSGASLEARLEKQGRLSLNEAALVLRQMLEAVHHCHKQGIVHRDLKADNFVFESDEAAAAVKLIDFGLANKCEMGQFLDARAGTIEYSAPEVLGSDGAGFGLPADLWALGAVLFLMITGEPLIKVENPRSTDEEARQRLRQEAREKVCGPHYVRLRLAAASTAIPFAALDLLEALLARDPRERIRADEALQHPFVQIAARA